MSHDGKDLVQILEDHPRDDMFQISVPELYDIAIGVLQLQERRRLRLFMRRDVYGRSMSCLVYLPRDRYNTDVRLKMRAILLETLHGMSIEDTFRVAESVLARVHFVVRLTPESPPSSTLLRSSGSSSSRPAPGKTTSMTRSRLSSATTRKPRSMRVYRGCLPRGLQGGFLGRRRCP